MSVDNAMSMICDFDIIDISCNDGIEKIRRLFFFFKHFNLLIIIITI